MAAILPLSAARGDVVAFSPFSCDLREHMAGRVVHFEIPFDDGDRARSSYGSVFGWSMRSVPDLGSTLVSTGPVSDEGMPREVGDIGGGVVERQDEIRTRWS